MIDSNFYREILKSEFDRRKNVNSRYSLRAFSKLLDMDVASLSRFFSYKQSFTRKTAKKICDKLKFDEEKKNDFCHSLILEKQSKKN